MSTISRYQPRQQQRQPRLLSVVLGVSVAAVGVAAADAVVAADAAVVDEREPEPEHVLEAFVHGNHDRGGSVS